MKVLITGFEPFGKDKINPSIEAVRRMPNIIQGCTLIKAEIPTTAYLCEQVMLKLIDEHQPDFVINVGQAGGRSNITFERVAININDFSIPDNGGQQFVDVLIKEDGADGYFSDLPIKALVRALRKEGYPSAVSNTAGTFVCNHIMYCMQYAKHKTYPHLKTGFVHIPYLPEQVADKNVASMDLDMIVNALICMVEHLNDKEIKEEAGSIC